MRKLGRMKKKVGLIGCGAIGSLISEAAEKGLIPCDELVLYDFEAGKAQKLKERLNFPSTVAASFEDLLAAKPKVIVEAASQQAARDLVPRIVKQDIDVIVMSSGALLSLPPMGKRVHVPSGAIGGLDALSSAALAGIDEVVLTSRKNPRALERTGKQEELVYEGSAEDAAVRFPREMNVAATLAFTVKPAKVRVRVISDPMVVRNTHEIVVKWRFGEMFLRFANDPHPDNPRTSALAAWSAIRLLGSLLQK